MSQDKILNLLKNNKDWLSCKQIAEKLEATQSSVSKALMKMRNYNIINFQNIYNNSRSHYVYKAK